MVLFFLGYGIIEGIRHVGRKQILLYFFMVSVAIALYSYHIVPLVDSDLLRHFQNLDMMRSWTFAKLISYDQFAEQPLSKLYFYLISKIGTNGMLTAVSGFFIYFAPLLCLHGVMNRDSNLSKYNIDNTFAFFMCAFMFTIVPGVRQGLGFALFFFGIYFQYIMRSKNTVIAYLFYTSACLMHSSMFTILVLSILFELVHGKRKAEGIALLLVLSWSIFIPLFQYLLTYLSSIPFFHMLYGNILIYIGYNRIRVPTYLLHVGLLTMLTMLYLYSARFSVNKRVEELFPGLLSLYRAVLCFTWGSLLIYDIFIRFTQFSLMWSVIMLPFIFSSDANNTKDKILFLVKIGTVSLVSFYALLSYSVLFY